MTKQNLSRTCKGVKKDGSPCPLPPKRGSEYCRWHQHSTRQINITAGGQIQKGELVFKGADGKYYGTGFIAPLAAMVDIESGQVPSFFRPVSIEFRYPKPFFEELFVHYFGLDEDYQQSTLCNPCMDRLVLHVFAGDVTLNEQAGRKEYQITGSEPELTIFLPTTFFTHENPGSGKALKCFINGKVFSFSVESEGWEQQGDNPYDVISKRNAWMELLWPSQSEDLSSGHKEKGKGRRSQDLVPVPNIDRPMRFPTQSHLNMTIVQTYFSKLNEWQHSEYLGSYFLETPHGRAVAENVNTLPLLQQFLEFAGAEGLQYTCAAVEAYTKYQRCRHGKLPDYSECTPMTIHAASLLRAMGRASQGKHGGYSRREQSRARQFLKAASVFHFGEVTPISKNSARLNYGPILAVVDTEIDMHLPFDSVDDTDEDLISITIMPGRTFWGMVKDGRHWVPQQLLHYHPKNDKYAIAVGFYLADKMMVRRKKGEDSISIETIEREARIASFDKNEQRRLENLIKAIHKLAADGVIGGKDGRAIIESDKRLARKSTIEALRAQRVKLIIPTEIQQAMTGNVAIDVSE